MTMYDHFHPDEHAFVDKAWDWVRRAAEQHSVKLVDFMDPRQAFILESLVHRHGDAVCWMSGGYDRAERKRAVVAPDYRTPGEDDVAIALLEITSDDAKFGELDHGDFLGSLLGLGIKRDKLGDLHVLPGKCHCLLAEEIAAFVHLNLRQVGRVRVMTETLPLNRLETGETELAEMSFTVASLRLDAIVGDVHRLSRAKALVPIRAGRCKVNWKPEEDPARQVKAGDVVSLQGFGRFRIIDVEGPTKSGRIRVKIGKYV